MELKAKVQGQMRTKSGITLQEAHELNQFVEHLQIGGISTAEFKNVLMTLRQYSKSKTLREWTDGVAHTKRNRGETYQAGSNLWLERFQIYAYFSGHPDLNRIPIPIFDMLVYWIESKHWGVDGFFLKELYPLGHSPKEIAASLVFMYRKLPKDNVYELIPGEKNAEDLLLIQEVLPKLERTNWSGSPINFKNIVSEIATEFQRLMGVGKRKITKHKDLLALHFLCAFHLMEIELESFKDSKTRCYLSLDSDDGKLSLNLALYQHQNGIWKQLEISDGTYDTHTGRINHCYSRPYLVTGLSERKYCPKTRCDSLFQHAVEVKTNWIRKYIGRV